MKTERNILIAFLLNILFSVFEFVGGLFTGSIAIVSDAVHDLGDAFSIGVSYFLEKKSKRKPDNKHTYGYECKRILFLYQEKIYFIHIKIIMKIDLMKKKQMKT